MKPRPQRQSRMTGVEGSIPRRKPGMILPMRKSSSGGGQGLFHFGGAGHVTPRRSAARGSAACRTRRRTISICRQLTARSAALLWCTLRSSPEGGESGPGHLPHQGRSRSRGERSRKGGSRKGDAVRSALASSALPAWPTLKKVVQRWYPLSPSFSGDGHEGAGSLVGLTALPSVCSSSPSQTDCCAPPLGAPLPVPLPFAARLPTPASSRARKPASPPKQSTCLRRRTDP